MASANGSWPHATPRFQATQVTDQLREGYWLEAPDIDGDGRPDLMGYGLSTGELYWYRNPEWSRYLLTNGIKEPVGADFADISGLSNEMKQKFAAARPRTVGQAGRLDGVTPAALTLLAAHLRRAARRNGERKAARD